MASKVGITLILVLCLFSQAECIFFDLLGGLFSAFGSLYGLDSSIYGSSKMNSNVWRDSAQPKSSGVDWNGVSLSAPDNQRDSSIVTVDTVNRFETSNRFDANRVNNNNNRFDNNNNNNNRFDNINNNRSSGSQLDFNFNENPDGWAYFEGRVGNWIVDRGEVGIGKLYNQRWGNNVIMELDSDENQVYRYPLNLEGGLYQLNFNWAARENQPLETSKFTVRLNGEDIASFVPKDYEINRFSQVVRTLPQTNDLKLIATGRSDTFGATVANFAVFKASQFDGTPGFVNNPQDLPITYIQGNVFDSIRNFVSNGDFELPKLTLDNMRS